MDTINCAIVGYGGIALFHTRAFLRIPGVRLRTVVGRRAEPAESFREAWGFDNATTRYEDVLTDPRYRRGRCRLAQRGALRTDPAGAGGRQKRTG